MSIEQETDDLQRMTEGQLRRFRDRANTIEQVRAAGALLEEINRRRLAEAVREFRQGTAVFIDLTEKLEALIATIKVDPPAGALATFNGLLDSATRLHAAIRDPERFAHAIEEGEDHLILLPLRDEALNALQSIGYGDRMRSAADVLRGEIQQELLAAARGTEESTPSTGVADRR